MVANDPGAEPHGRDTGGIAVLGVQLINVGVTAALIGFSAEWWTHLPDQSEAHWTMVSAGRTVGPQWWAWFTVPLIGTVVTVAFLASRGLKGVAGRHPWLISLPRRKTFLALPEPARNRVLHAAFTRLAFFPLPINLFLLYGQWVNFQVATGRGGVLHWTAMGALFLGALLVLILYFLSVASIITAEQRKAGA